MVIAPRILLAPEEKLYILYRLLATNNYLDASIFFKMYSTMNQYKTFLQAIKNEVANIIMLRDYIIMLSRNSVFVVGFDDNYRFFCHNIPDRIDDLSEISSENDLKRLMRFNLHYWELENESIIRPPVRIRLQGDIILGIDEQFNSLNSLLVWLGYKFIEYLFKKLSRKVILGMLERLRIMIDTNNLEALLEELKFLLETDYKSYLLRIKLMINSFHFQYFHYRSTACESKIFESDFVICLIREILMDIFNKIRRLERRIIVRIGNHKITLIGVPLDEIRTFSFEILRLSSNPRASFLLLRRQTIYAHHDEHNDVALSINPSIIHFETIPAGPYQVTRDNLLFESIDLATLSIFCNRKKNISNLRIEEIEIKRNIPIKILVLTDPIKYRKYIMLADTNIYYLCENPNFETLKLLIGFSILANNKIAIAINSRTSYTIISKIRKIFRRFLSKIRIFIIEGNSDAYFWFEIKEILNKLVESNTP